jgi:hypothetical protein
MLAAYCENHTKHRNSLFEKANILLKLNQVERRVNSVHEKPNCVERLCTKRLRKTTESLSEVS